MGEHKLKVLEGDGKQDFGTVKPELEKIIKTVIFHVLGPAFQKHCTECLVKRGLCYRFLSVGAIEKLNEIPILFTPEFCVLAEVEKLEIPKVEIPE